MGVSVAEAQVLPADKQAELVPVRPVQPSKAGTHFSVSGMNMLVSCKHRLSPIFRTAV